ncbi:hypothetical protein ACWY4P_28820 [Streptomyces sp. LZ34]
MAPVRAYLEALPPDVLSGAIQPGKVFDAEVALDNIAEGYRAMDERRAIKVLVRPNRPTDRPSAAAAARRRGGEMSAMRYRRLGNSDLEVSEPALATAATPGITRRTQARR